MTFLKRLRVLPAVLGVGAALAAISTSCCGDGRTGAIRPRPAASTTPRDGTPWSEGLRTRPFAAFAATAT